MNTRDFAFPGSCTSDGHGANVDPGMTLRDYFAAKAVAAWGPHITDGPCRMDQSTFQLAAITAYQIADAMLAEREKQK